MPVSEQGSTYTAFVESGLTAEYGRRATLDSRARELTKTSSAFIALVVALLALIVGKDYKFSAFGAWVAVVALGAFVVASFLALLSSAARVFNVTSQGTVEEMLGAEHWMDDEVDARYAVATANALTTWSLRRGNNTKARLLQWALGCQVTGYVLLTAATGVEIARALRAH